MDNDLKAKYETALEALKVISQLEGSLVDGKPVQEYAREIILKLIVDDEFPVLF